MFLPCLLYATSVIICTFLLMRVWGALFSDIFTLFVWLCRDLHSGASSMPQAESLPLQKQVRFTLIGSAWIHMLQHRRCHKTDAARVSTQRP
jgi:hypothetical protein